MPVLHKCQSCYSQTQLPTSLNGWVVICDTETVRARLGRCPEIDRSKFIGQTKSDPRSTRKGLMTLKNCKLKISSPL